MIVQKFGGTSVGSADNLKKVSRIISQNKDEKIVVVSAMAGVTNKLYSIIELLKQSDKQNAKKQLNSLKNIFINTTIEIIDNKNYRLSSIEFINEKFNEIDNLFLGDYSLKTEFKIVALGEICTSYILSSFMNSSGDENLFIYAPDFLIKNLNNEPDLGLTEILLNKILAEYQHITTIITQGFICSDVKGELSNLGRGGSDYSATIIGSILNVNEIQIWSDQEGILNNDPRFVENTFPLQHVSYTEAEELAYFGAKILHPLSIYPAQKKGIRILVKNTFNPKSFGTEITSLDEQNGIKAVAAKDNISILRIKSGKMMNAFGFLKKIFQVFDDFKTPVDVITTSEVSVSVTIENDFRLIEIANKLMNIAEVEIVRNQSIVCIVGDFNYTKKGVAAHVFDAIKKIPINMISQGASNHNMTLVIDSDNKIRILNLLNDKIFNKENICIQQ